MAGVPYACQGVCVLLGSPLLPPMPPIMPTRTDAGPRWLLLPIVAFALAACAGGDTTGVCAVGPVTVTLPAATIALGQTAQASADYSVQNCNFPPQPTWLSENTAIATVDGNGLVTAVAIGGPVNIRATVSGKSNTVSVSVVQPPVATVSVTPATANVVVGQTTTLVGATLSSTGATLTGRTITWTSANTSRATVANGVVTGVAPGPVTITATSEGQSGTAVVTVLPVPVATVTIAPGPVTMVPVRGKLLSAVARDGQGNVLTGRTATWTSSNTAVATVVDGFISTFTTGTSTITATVDGVPATTTLTVVAQTNLGYGVANQPGSFSSYVVAESFTNPGDSVTARKTATGAYEVRVLGMAATSAARRFVYVNSRDAAVQCHPAGAPTAHASGAMLIAVSCASVTTGADTDAAFSFLALGADALSGRTGFLASPTAAISATPFEPTSAFSFSSRGTDANVLVSSSAAGVYAAQFAALARGGTDGPEEHFAQSWDTSPGSWCASGGWNFGGFQATIRCYNQAGTLADARFGTLVIENGRVGKRFAIAWVFDPVAPVSPSGLFTYTTGGPLQLSKVSIGVHDLSFPGLGGTAGVPVSVIVSSYGSTNAHCTVTAVTRNGADLVARVQCVSPVTGAPVDQRFTIAVIE